MTSASPPPEGDGPAEPESNSAHPLHASGAVCPECLRLEGPVPRYELTEHGDALRFWFRYRYEIRYIYEEDTFLFWNGTVWLRDRKSKSIETRRRFCAFVGRQLEEEAMELRLRAADATAAGEEKEANSLKRQADAVRQWKRHAHSRAGMSASIEIFTALEAVTVSTTDLDRSGTLLTFQNGTLDLVLGELRAPDSKDLVTKCLPYDYDPNATAPQFNKFLDRVIPDPEVRGFLQRFCGRMQIWLNERRPLLVQSGGGRNGKSTFQNAIQSVLGPHAANADVVTFLEKKGDRIENDLARMAKTRAVFVRELPSNRRIDESLIKQLTGGDRVSARFLWGEYFEFEPGFLIVLSTNFHPVIGDSVAMRDRVYVVPFAVTLDDAELDLKLGTRLLDERSGIFNWAFEGLKDWRLRGGFAPPAAVREFTDSIVDENLGVRQFVADCLTKLPPDSGRYLASHRAYLVYRTWAQRHGVKRPWPAQWFGRKMVEDGIRSSKFGTQNDRGFPDIAVGPDWIQVLWEGLLRDPVGLLSESYFDLSLYGGTTSATRRGAAQAGSPTYENEGFM